MENKITKIVLTGGPCAGKTSALKRIRKHFSSKGYHVFSVPEVPTMITESGWNYLTDNKDFYFEGELAILELQLSLEDKVVRMAQTLDAPSLVICDRGTMDISAYISPEMWQELASRVGFTVEQLQNRYDAVLHLLTAADGFEIYYNLATNAQRYEQVNEAGFALARELDKKVLNAWQSHPYHRVIGNDHDFEVKMQHVLDEVNAYLQTK